MRWLAEILASLCEIWFVNWTSKPMRDAEKKAEERETASFTSGGSTASTLSPSESESASRETRP